MKKAIGLLLFMTMLFAFAGCNSDDPSGSAGAGGDNPADGGASAAGSVALIQPGDYPAEHTYPFQSKTKTLDGIAIGNDIYIPFVEFVEDMGYTYEIDGNTVTVHNTDYSVDHVLEVDSSVVVTGEVQATMFGNLQYVERNGETTLYVPTELYAIFDGNFDLSS